LDVLEDRTLPSTFTVLNLNDGGPGSLRTEVAAANATLGTNTIAFAHGLHGTITLTSGELLISNSVTINGPGANTLSVSGDHASRIFEIAAGLNVTIDGLTITAGFVPDQGAGILNDGSNLTLSGDNLTQNVAFGSGNGPNSGGRGGALYSASGTLTITGCQISANQALGGTSVGGLGIGGGIYILAGSATVSNSTISGNLAHGACNNTIGVGQAGGIELASGTLVVSGSTITGNQAVGGANNGGLDGYGLGGGINSDNRQRRGRPGRRFLQRRHLVPGANRCLGDLEPCQRFPRHRRRGLQPWGAQLRCLDRHRRQPRQHQRRQHRAVMPFGKAAVFARRAESFAAGRCNLRPAILVTGSRRQRNRWQVN
jgi:hypothetical protein